jgi:hypothetical protein
MRRTFSNMRQFGKKLVEFLLTLIQFSSTSVVNSKEGHDAVDNKETVLIPDEELGNLVQKLHLMLGVDSTSVGDVVLRYAPLVRYSTGTGTRTCLWIDPKSLSNLSNSLWSEGTFRVCDAQSAGSSRHPIQHTDVCHFSLGTAHILRQLRNDGHRMRHLRLSATKFPKNFADAHCLEATESVSTSSGHQAEGCTHPPRMVSSCLLPVEIFSTRFRCCPSS